ncbi:MAG TPA: DUF3293 domain-containing protein [Longimicrobiaceae bacterium]|nr:DUF3293 domain-containing protein [Longimicrobiaceae bacterium]
MTEPPAAYLATVLEIFPPAGAALSIDLRRPVAPGTAEALLALLGGPFAVVTACNPRGEVIEATENERRARALEAELRRRSVEFLRADGRSPDGSHRERGVAARLPRPSARDLAAHLQQQAYYWFDGAAFWLMGVLLETAPLRLPT